MSGLVSAHMFTPPVDEPWGPCVICRYGEPAHERTGAQYQTPENYRCPYCVDRRVDPCKHGRAGALDLKMQPLRGNHAQPPERG